MSVSAPKVGNSSTVNDIRTLVLVGKTGNGKSATGNSILGKGTFSLSWARKSVAVKGQTIEVIDTPGVMDTSSEHKTIANEILNSINLATHGIHALLIVLTLRGRFSDADANAVYYLLDLFGINILKYVILVFTGGDDLDAEDKEGDRGTNGEGDRLTDYLRGNCPDSLLEILGICCNRMVLFDNKTEDETKNSNQVHKLLSLIDQVQAENGGEPYTKQNCGEEVTMRLQGKEVAIGGGSSFLKAKFKKAYEEQLKQTTAKNDSNLREIKTIQDENRTQEVAKLMEENKALANEIEKNKELLESSKARERAVEDIKKIVLIGKTGSGKTSTGYSIMGKPELSPSLSKKSDAKHGVTSGFYTVQHESIEIVDTPGRLFETALAHKSVANEFLSSIDSENTGIHAVLIVLSLKTKSYEEEKALVYALQVLFGKQICNYMIVVLTGGDSLNKEASNEIVEDKVLDNHLRLNHSKSLEDILTLCGNRKVLFDNKTTDESKKSNQVKKLFSLVHKILAENGGEPYTYRKPEENASISARQQESELPQMGELKYETIPKIWKESDEISTTNEKGMKDMENHTAPETQLNASMKDQGQEDGFYGESSRSKGNIQKPQEELTAAKQSARKFQLTPKMESKLSKTQSKPRGETSAQQELTAAKQPIPEQIKSYIEIPKGSTPEIPNVGSKTVELVREAGNAQSETSNNAVGNEVFVPSLSLTSDAKTVVAETNDHIEVLPINIIDTPDHIPKVLLINKVVAENGGDPATRELAEKESELPETGELQYDRIPKIVKELNEIGMAKEKDRREYKKAMKNRTAREKQLRRELKREMRGVSKMSKQRNCGSCSIL